MIVARVEYIMIGKGYISPFSMKGVDVLRE